MNTMNVGISTRSAADSFAAGQEAVEQALEPLHGRANFLFMTATPEYNHAEMLRGIYSQTDIPGIGCVIPWMFTRDGLFDRHMVAVMALQVRDVRILIEYGQKMEDLADSRRTGERFAESVLPMLLAADEPGTSPILLVLADDQMFTHSISGGLSDMLGPLLLMAGGAIKKEPPTGCMFVNDTPLEKALVGALITPYAPVGIGVAHGWSPSGQSVVTTQSSDNRIFELNGRPALETYREMWQDIFPDVSGKPYAEIRSEFIRVAAYHPVGLAQMTGEYLVRELNDLREDGSVMCGADVPENAILHFMQGTPATLAHAASLSVRQAFERLEGHVLEGMLCFDCISRCSLLNYDMRNELASILAELPEDAPLLGIPSWGELANPLKNSLIFHNKTLVSVAFSAPTTF